MRRHVTCTSGGDYVALVAREKVRRHVAVIALVATAGIMSPGTASAKPQATCRGYLACLALGVRAYVYSYPLVMTGVTEGVSTNVPNATTSGGRAPVNQLSNNKIPTGEQESDIVLPNVNTPYSLAWLDLTKEPMILHLPDLTGRFFVMESMNAWTDVITNSPGTRTAAGPGDYAYVGPGFKGKLPRGIKEVLRFPTNTVFIAGRIYSTGAQDDLTEVATIQTKLSLVPLSKYGKPYTPPSNVPYDPSLDMSAPYLQVQNMDAATFYDKATRLMGPNPPAPADATLVREMAKIGMVPGSPFRFDTLDPVTRRALQDALNTSCSSRTGGSRRRCSASRHRGTPARRPDGPRREVEALPSPVVRRERSRYGLLVSLACLSVQAASASACFWLSSGLRARARFSLSTVPIVEPWKLGIT